MKGVLFFAAILLMCSFAGCAVAEQDASGVGEQFQQGLQGRGQIVPNNPTSDSFGSDYQ